MTLTVRPGDEQNVLSAVPGRSAPPTLITRDRDEIKAFAREHGGDIVIKPLAGFRWAGCLSRPKVMTSEI